MLHSYDTPDKNGPDVDEKEDVNADGSKIARTPAAAIIRMLEVLMFVGAGQSIRSDRQDLLESIFQNGQLTPEEVVKVRTTV